MRIGNIRHKLTLFLALLVVVTSIFSLKPMSTNAVSGSDWQAGDIVNDGIFFNGASITAGQIQNFLNAKVPTCDTNGSQIYSGSTTRAQYGASRGYPAPYICLKDYSQNTPSMGAEPGLCNAYGGGTKGSAQLIYDVARACGVNSQVLLVLLQKEQSLVTDEWPFPNQYASATGFGCPDTAPCDASYNNFFYQVYYAARQFKAYQKNASVFNHRVGRTSSILYNPSSSCGSSGVYIQNQATAGLYNYTPYQPNAAALANLYGTGDSCSAYGNRNFWRMFTDWFGPTTDSDTYFAVTNTNPSNGLNMWYLITPTGKYYIPSGDIYNAWGLSNFSFQTVTQQYFESLPDRGNLGRVLKDKYNNYFMVDNGQTHYVRDANYIRLWGADPASAAQSTGLSYSLPQGNWIGRFAQDISTGQQWLLDGATKHLVGTPSLLYHWRYTPDQLTSVTSTYLATFATGDPLSQAIRSGGTYSLADSGRLLTFDNSKIQAAYNLQSPTNITSSIALAFLPREQASNFVVDSTSGAWFMVEASKRHYIQRSSLARNWGYSDSRPLTTLSNAYITGLDDGGNLSYIAQDGRGQTWVFDGQKHQLSTTTAINAWKPTGGIPTYSSDSIDLVATGSVVKTLVQPQGSNYVYTLDSGSKRYVPSQDTASAWGNGSFDGVVQLNSTLVNEIPETAPVSFMVQNGGTYYLLMNGTAYPINTLSLTSWSASAQTQAISDLALSRFTISATQLGSFIKIGGNYFIMNSLYAIPVTTFLDAYGLNDTNSVSLPSNYFATTAAASYLIRSTDNTDARMWLVSQGKKLLFSNFAQQANYGYISKGAPVTSLPPSVLATIPDSAQSPSLLITKPNAGIKLLSFGSALGFPDGQTLLSYVSDTNPILTLSPSVYDQFVLRAATSRLIRDDSGKVYLVENGAKRWIWNGNALKNNYGGIPITYLEGTTIVSMPTGTPLN